MNFIMSPSIIDTPPDNILLLPWPDKRLSPNARVHWSSRAKASKAARQQALLLAKKAGWNRYYLRTLPQYSVINSHSIAYLTARYNLYIDFYPPDKRKRDDDNLIAAFKPYRDGIAQALEIDDFRFRSIITLQDTVIRDGQVKVWIRI